MKAILIDDEYYALYGLKIELEKIGGIEIVGMYEDGNIALKEINDKKPDIAFLDIEMPSINGLDLFQKLLEQDSNIKIVFTTAYNHYAVEAFELNAIDYLIKPVQNQRLLKTMERLSHYPKPKEKNIKIECFKHFSIFIDDIEVNKGWRTKKAEELLAYLICKKGKFVSKEKIAEDLWPDLDGEKSMANLYLAYYYIKKQGGKLGGTFPIESERGKMRFKIEEVYCDFMAFDKCVEKCKILEDGNIEIAEKAIEIYEGMLFEDSYYSWAVGIQREYETRYLDILKRMASYFKKQDNKEKIKILNSKIRLSSR